MTAHLPLIALISYPILALIFVGKLEQATVRRFINIMMGINLATIWGALLHLYTIWPLVNTFLVTLVYFNLCVVTGLMFLHKQSITKITGLLLMILVFGLGYLIAVYGWMGTGIASSDGQKEIEHLQNGISVERTPMGSNIIKYRGLKVEVYKQVAKFPVLKLRVAKKAYYDTILPYCNSFKATYEPVPTRVLISCESFSDTMVLDK